MTTPEELAEAAKLLQVIRVALAAYSKARVRDGHPPLPNAWINDPAAVIRAAVGDSSRSETRPESTNLPEPETLSENGGDMRKLLTRDQVAAWLNRSPRQVDRYRAAGDLVAVRLDRSVLFEREAVEDFITSHRA